MAFGKVIKYDAPSEPVQERDREPRPAAPRPGRAGVVNAEVFEAHEEAKNIIAAARQRSAEIIEEAKAERVKVLAEARELGRQEGLAGVTELRLKAKARY